MSIPELLGIVGGLVSFLTMLVVGLVGVVYRNDQKVAESGKTQLEARIASLEKQNLEQETRIATLTATTTYAERGSTRLIESLDKLDGRVDELGHEISGLRGELVQLSRRLTGGAGGLSPGTMPAVKPPR